MQTSARLGPVVFVAVVAAVAGCYPEGNLEKLGMFGHVERFGELNGRALACEIYVDELRHEFEKESERRLLSSEVDGGRYAEFFKAWMEGVHRGHQAQLAGDGPPCDQVGKRVEKWLSANRKKGRS